MILEIEIDVELEKNRRFKSLVCEYYGQNESWYYNDGSEFGKHIITFQLEEQKYDSLNPSFDITYKIITDE